MKNIPEIKLIIRFAAVDRIPADLVGRIIVAIDKSIIDCEIDELENAKTEIHDIPEDVIDEIRKSLDSGELKGLFLEEASSGSIILAGVVAGLAAYALRIIEKTIIKDIETVWSETSLSKRFRQFMLTSIPNKIDRMISVIDKNIKKSIILDIEGIKLSYKRSKDEENYFIAIMIEFTRKYPRWKLAMVENEVDLDLFKKSSGSEGEESGGALAY